MIHIHFPDLPLVSHVTVVLSQFLCKWTFFSPSHGAQLLPHFTLAADPMNTMFSVLCWTQTLLECSAPSTCCHCLNNSSVQTTEALIPQTLKYHNLRACGCRFRRDPRPAAVPRGFFAEQVNLLRPFGLSCCAEIVSKFLHRPVCPKAGPRG